MTFYDLILAERAARERYYELLREADVERMLRTRVPMRPKRTPWSLTFTSRRPRGFWGTPRLRSRVQPQPLSGPARG